MAGRVKGPGSVWLRGLAAVLGLGVVAGAGASAEADGINVDQLRRVLDGETIVERGDVAYTDEFFIEGCRFAATGENRFFVLRPCYQLYLAGEDDGEFVELYVTVLPETHRVRLEIGGREVVVLTRVVEEREYADGELAEVSRNYFAICRETGAVFYFGEDVCIVEDEGCSDEGAWEAGEDGARPGVIMPGMFLLGARYFQEIAPGVAEDRAEHAAMGLDVEVPAGMFEDCVMVVETSALEPGSESVKRYCPDVGLVDDDGLELVWFGFVPCGGLDEEEEEEDGE